MSIFPYDLMNSSIITFCSFVSSDSSVGGLRSFGRFDSVDQMNIHQKLYDFNGENDDDFRLIFNNEKAINPF